MNKTELKEWLEVVSLFLVYTFVMFVVISFMK